MLGLMTEINRSHFNHTYKLGHVLYFIGGVVSLKVRSHGVAAATVFFAIIGFNNWITLYVMESFILCGNSSGSGSGNGNGATSK